MRLNVAVPSVNTGIRFLYALKPRKSETFPQKDHNGCKMCFSIVLVTVAIFSAFNEFTIFPRTETSCMANKVCHQFCKY